MSLHVPAATYTATRPQGSSANKYSIGARLNEPSARPQSRLSLISAALSQIDAVVVNAILATSSLSAPRVSTLSYFYFCFNVPFAFRSTML
jgi:hypothetical protein